MLIYLIGLFSPVGGVWRPTAGSSGLRDAREFPIHVKNDLFCCPRGRSFAKMALGKSPPTGGVTPALYLDYYVPVCEGVGIQY